METILKDAYFQGYKYGQWLRNGMPAPPPPDGNLDVGAWELIGRRDGLENARQLDFDRSIGLAGSRVERQQYDDGYTGKPVNYVTAWYQQGAFDRSQGLPRNYLMTRSFPAGPLPVETPRGNGPVIVQPPPYGGYPQPPLTPQRRRRRGGIVIQGPWGRINLSELLEEFAPRPRYYDPRTGF